VTARDTGRAETSPRDRSTAAEVAELVLTGAELAGRVLLAGVVIAGVFAIAGLHEAVEAIRARSRCQDCGGPAGADRCDDCDEQARGGA